MLLNDILPFTIQQYVPTRRVVARASDVTK